MREVTMIKADLSQGTLEALQISRSPGSRLPEELTVCYPSMCGLRKITYESEKMCGQLKLSTECKYVVILCNF